MNSLTQAYEIFKRIYNYIELNNGKPIFGLTTCERIKR